MIGLDVRTNALGQRIVVAFAIATAMVAASAIVGCQPKPAAPLAAPRAELAVDHFAGTALSGPAPVVASASPASQPTTQPNDALAIGVTFIALERVPDRVFDSLGSRARLISSTAGNSPLLSSGRLTERVSLF